MTKFETASARIFNLDNTADQIAARQLIKAAGLGPNATDFLIGDLCAKARVWDAVPTYAARHIYNAIAEFRA